MQPIRRTMAVLASAGLLLVVALGCSSLPTDPARNPAYTAEDMVRLPAPGGLVGDLGGLVGGALEQATKTVKKVKGYLGGSVSMGRFTVEVPCYAFEGEAEISVTVPDSTTMLVQLHIQDVPNHFEIPVILEVSVAGVEGQDIDPTALNIFWHDEVADVWHQLPTTYDPRRQVVSTPLDHFSEYGVLEAKAGW